MERDEVLERRRQEDEELARRRRGEDEEWEERLRQEDEERERRLEKEREEVERETEELMGEIERGWERRWEEGREVLRGLEGRRKVCFSPFPFPAYNKSKGVMRKRSAEVEKHG